MILITPRCSSQGTTPLHKSSQEISSPNQKPSQFQYVPLSFFASRKQRQEIVKNLDSINGADIKIISLEILKMESKDRLREELMVLQKATNKIEFFKQMLEKQDDDTLQLCLKHMTLEFHNQNTILFEKGDQASKFYIIIDGQVGVYVTDNTTEGKEKEEKEKLKELKKARHRPSIIYRAEIGKQVGLANLFSGDEQETQENAKAVKAQILQQKINGLLKVNQMQEGKAFGELALINDAPRLATIVCEQDCNFGVLNKQDYKQILLEGERKKVEKNVQELSENPGFQNLSRRLLNILLYAFKPISFSFREFVYKQGDKSTVRSLDKNQRNDAIYIVQYGEFQVMGITNLTLNDWAKPSIHQQGLQQNSSVMERQSIGRAPTSLATLARGQIFGDDEAFKPQPRKYSVQCRSDKGQVLSISLQELTQRVQVTNETALIDFIQQISKEKILWRKFFHEQSRVVLERYKNLVSNVSSIPNQQNKEYFKQKQIQTEISKEKLRATNEQKAQIFHHGKETTYNYKKQITEQNTVFMTEYNESVMMTKTQPQQIKKHSFSPLKKKPFLDSSQQLNRKSRSGSEYSPQMPSLYLQFEDLYNVPNTNNNNNYNNHNNSRNSRIQTQHNNNINTNNSNVSNLTNGPTPSIQLSFDGISVVSRSPLRTTIKSIMKEQKMNSLLKEPRMQIKFERIIDAKQNLFDKMNYPTCTKSELSNEEIDEQILNESREKSKDDLLLEGVRALHNKQKLINQQNRIKQNNQLWPNQCDFDNILPKTQKTQLTESFYRGQRDEMYTIQRVLNTGKHVCQRKKKQRLLDSYMTFLSQKKKSHTVEIVRKQ